MKAPEQILEDGRNSRRRREEYETALNALRNSTKRHTWFAVFSLLFAGLFSWFLYFQIKRDGPVTNADVVNLGFIALAALSQFYLGITHLHIRPKDVALRNLIEERLKEDANRAAPSGREAGRANLPDA